MREGYPAVLSATTLAVVLFAAALRLRSWSMWLTALAATVTTLVIAWWYR
jgi:hypothetical protein